MAAPLWFVGLKREQSFQKIVLAVNQHAVGGPRTAGMTKNSGRRRIIAAHRRKAAIDQRLRDASAFPAIKRGLFRVSNLMGKTQQSSGDDGRRRGVAIAVVHTLIVKVIPRDSILRTLTDNIVRHPHS